MDKPIKTKETLPHKENRTKSFIELHSKQHIQAAESSRSRPPTDAAPVMISSKDRHTIKHSENVNSKSEAQPSPRKPSPRHGTVSSSRPEKPHTGQRDRRPMRSDLVAPNSGGGRPFHERPKPIPRPHFSLSTSQSRRGENNASTSNDTTTAASKLLPVQKRRPLQGGFFDKTVIHNSDGGTVYYKSKEIRSSKEDSSEQQSSSTSGQQGSSIETYDLHERRWEST